MNSNTVRSFGAEFVSIVFITVKFSVFEIYFQYHRPYHHSNLVNVNFSADSFCHYQTYIDMNILLP